MAHSETDINFKSLPAKKKVWKFINLDKSATEFVLVIAEVDPSLTDHNTSDHTEVLHLKPHAVLPEPRSLPSEPSN